MSAAEAAWQELALRAPAYAPGLARLAVVRHLLGDERGAREAARSARAAGGEVPPQLEALLRVAGGTHDSLLGGAALAGTLPGVGSQVRLPTPENTSFAYAAETSVVTTELDPDHLVAAWTDARFGGSERFSRVAVGESLDGGITWSSFLLEAPAEISTARQGDPMTAYDHRTGTMWAGGVTLGEPGKNGIFVARRRPGAAGFDPPVVAVRHAGVDKPWMAAGPDPENPQATRLYLVSTVGLQVSGDLGQTWSEPRPLEGFLGLHPRVGPQGELYVIYWDADDGVMLHRSFDGGRTLEGPIRVATRLDVWDTGDGSRFPGSFRVPPFSYLAVSPVDGTLYALWFDTTSRVDGESDVDLYLATSTDRGATRKAPRRVPQQSGTAGDQFFPWLEVDAKGRLHMVFYDTRHGVQSDRDEAAEVDAYYAYSEDGGRRWIEHRLTDSSFSTAEGLWPSGQFLGDYLGLATAGDRAYPVYVSAQNGQSDVFVNVVDLASDTGAGPPGSGSGGSCRADDVTLCLGDGRFEVRLDWRTSQGDSGTGKARKLTPDSGYFWFFDETNVEVLIKVLDACGPFDRYWVFASGLTNVGVRLTVTDTHTGQVWETEQQPGRPFGPVQDTEAFDTCST